MVNKDIDQLNTALLVGAGVNSVVEAKKDVEKLGQANGVGHLLEEKMVKLVQVIVERPEAVGTLKALAEQGKNPVAQEEEKPQDALTLLRRAMAASYISASKAQKRADEIIRTVTERDDVVLVADTWLEIARLDQVLAVKLGEIIDGYKRAKLLIVTNQGSGNHNSGTNS